MRIEIGNRIAHFFSILCRIYYRFLFKHDCHHVVSHGGRNGNRFGIRNEGQGFLWSIRRNFLWVCSHEAHDGGCLYNCAFKLYTVIGLDDIERCDRIK